VVPKNQAEELLKLFGGKIVDFKASEPHVVGDVEPEVLRQCIPTIEVFTTRPDTIFGATYLVLAPEHQLIQNLESSIKNLAEVKKYIARAKKKTEEKRIAEGREKTGVELKGIKAVNPANKKEIPVWVADYVLGSYGTGAIMAVPAHDERDREFAEKFNLPVNDAPLVNAEEILPKIGGRRKVQYRLRDWLISRQRYWGPPIPLVFCKSCKKQAEISNSQFLISKQNPKPKTQNFNLGELENPGWVPVPEKDLPVKLPFVKDFRPKGKGVSPLASVKNFYEVKCPRCGGRARRETDVSDTFLDSAWYYLGYLAKENSQFEIQNSPFRAKARRWLPVDMYIGGAEHAVLHLLYVRFLALALHDLGLLEFGDSPAPKGEPFPRFRAHGLLIKEGAKMSKSKGNIVNPDEYIKKFGADTLRMYLMFLAPFEQGGDFRDAGVLGISRFLERVWKIYQALEKGFKKSKEKIQTQPIDKSFHRTIKKVTEDVENLRYNTAISALMILLNEIEKEKSLLSFDHGVLFLKLLAPFAPHIVEEIWQAVLGYKNSIHLSEWPEYDPKLIEEETTSLIVQINGRVKAVLPVPKGIGQEEAEKIARVSAAVKKILEGKRVARIIFVKDKLINFVI
jgi:leucyl-tRNA synthetase